MRDGLSYAGTRIFQHACEASVKFGVPKLATLDIQIEQRPRIRLSFASHLARTQDMTRAWLQGFAEYIWKVASQQSRLPTPCLDAVPRRTL
jgi:hypothetical protein